MALDISGLNAAIQDILSGVMPTPTAADAGNAWGDAYVAYAATGQANSIPAVVPPTATDALKIALGSAFATLPGVPATVANAITSALLAFWPLVIFAGGTPPIPAAGAPVLNSTLASIFVVVAGTHASKSSEIGGALDVFTKAVIVIFPGPLPFPVV
jgi:hypothetical protein